MAEIIEVEFAVHELQPASESQTAYVRPARRTTL